MDETKYSILYSFISNIIFIIIIPIVIYLIVLFANIITDLVNPNKNYDSLVYFYINFLIIILLLSYLRSLVDDELIKNDHILIFVFIIASPIMLYHSKYFNVLKNINYFTPLHI